MALSNRQCWHWKKIHETIINESKQKFGDQISNLCHKFRLSQVMPFFSNEE